VRLKILATGAMVLALSANARADGPEQYSIHESLHVGDKIPGSMTVDQTFDNTEKDNGATVHKITHYKQFLKTIETVVAEKDGSATEAKIDVLSESYDTTKEGDSPETKTPCSLSGQSLNLRRRADETVINDFKGQADETDLDNVNGSITPDEDYFPDKSVAVGDSWDASDKVSKHADLKTGDKLLAQCKLDWVKETDGKKMGQITCVCATVRHGAGDIEQDMLSTTTCLVDMTAGQIVKADQTGTSHDFSPKDSTDPVEVKGEFRFHGEANGIQRATTQP